MGWNTLTRVLWVIKISSGAGKPPWTVARALWWNPHLAINSKSDLEIMVKIRLWNDRQNQILELWKKFLLGLTIHTVIEQGGSGKGIWDKSSWCYHYKMAEKAPALIWQKYLIRGRAVLSEYVATTRAGDVLPHLKIDIINVFLCQCWIGSIWNFIIGVTNICFANIELDQCETPAPICITNILLLGNDPTCCLEHWVCQAPKTQMLPIFSSPKSFKITWRKAGPHCHNLHRFLTNKTLIKLF